MNRKATCLLFYSLKILTSFLYKVALFLLLLQSYCVWSGEEVLPLQKWTKMQKPTTVDLFDVDNFGAEAISVGDSGIIVFRLGGRYHWATMDSQGISDSFRLNSVSNEFTAPPDYKLTPTLIVGDRGMIYTYVSKPVPWERMSSPTQENLNRIQVLAFNNRWIVGDNGTILHYDISGEWRKVDVPYKFDFTDIECIDSRNIWVVGSKGILHYDGVSWNYEFLELGEFPSISFVSPDKGWIVAASPDGKENSWIYHYDGKSWKLDTVLVGTTLKDLAFADILLEDAVYPYVGFAVGSDIYGFNGSFWKRVVENTRLNAISFSRCVEGAFFYAVGDQGEIYGYFLERE